MKSKVFIFFGLLLVAFKVSSQPGINPPKLTNPNSWSIILLPDPQGYTKFKRNQPILDVMFNWIENNRQTLNIKLVMCTGDLVEQNFTAKADKANGDLPSSMQWKAISNAFGKLDNKIPYILCTGNHDYGTNHTENRFTQFNGFFPPDRNPLNSSMLVDMAPNAMGVKTMENACYEFLSPSGQKMLIFSLEYLPRKAVVEWAKELSSQPKYAKHIGVVLTHSYMHSGVKQNQRITKEDYPPGFSDVTVGQKLWEEWINTSTNVQLVLCGHIIDVATHQGHVGFREDINNEGKKVNQMLFNAQNEGGNWQGNGGNGWLRILEFLPDKKTVLVKTYSPLFGSSPETDHLAWRKEAYDEFSFSIESSSPGVAK